jgi:hypothetical protein
MKPRGTDTGVPLQCSALVMWCSHADLYGVINRIQRVCADLEVRNLRADS